MQFSTATITSITDTELNNLIVTHLKSRDEQGSPLIRFSGEPGRSRSLASQASDRGGKGEEEKGHPTYLCVLVCPAVEAKIPVRGLRQFSSASEYHRTVCHEQGCGRAT